MSVLPTLTLFLLSVCPPPESIFPCSCHGKTGAEVICNQLKTQASLDALLKPLNGYSLTSLTLSNVNAPTLPTDVFQGLHVEELSLQKFEVNDASFRPGKRHLLGLESSLKKLDIMNSFRNGHRPLINFQLDHLKKLEVVLLEDNHIPEVGNDWFTSGPLSLTQLIFENNGIEEVGDQAFQALTDLQLLAVARNHLQDFARSMFPKPALRLRTLDLEGNKIRSIPRDLFSDMPSLADVNLNNNLIHLLPEEAFSFLSGSTELSVKGNPLECNEKLKWICKTAGKILGTCLVPAIHSGKSVDKFCQE